MKAKILLVGLWLVTGCGDRGGPDPGVVVPSSPDAGAGGCSSEPGFSCCQGGCGGDVLVKPSCTDGQWACTAPDVPPQQCAAAAGQHFCSGAPVGCSSAPSFSCCQGGCDGDILVNPTCENGRWSCVSPDVAPEQCAADAGQHFCSGPPVHG